MTELTFRSLQDYLSELADVVHYVVEIANVNGIDLGQAIIEKDKQASMKYKESPNLAEFLAKNS